MLSVIVPVYNERAALPAFLTMADAWDYPHELVFSDGGSDDGTLGLLGGRRVVRGPKGRGGQCRRGVAASRGDHLLFLHADTAVANEALAHVVAALDAGASWGCLTIDYGPDTPMYRFGVRKSNFRAGVLGTPFGDQGMFMTRAALDRVGGVPDLPLMEDYELSLRLRRAFGRPRQLPDHIHASARRFEAGNAFLVGLQMGWLRLRYRLGASPEELQRVYGDARRD